MISILVLFLKFCFKQTFLNHLFDLSFVGLMNIGIIDEESRKHLTLKEITLLESDSLVCESVFLPDVIPDDVKVPKIAKTSLGMFSGSIVRDMAVALSFGHGVSVRDAYDSMTCDGWVFDDKKYCLLLLESSIRHLVSPRASAIRVYDKRANASITMSRSGSSQNIHGLLEISSGCLGSVVRDVLHELFEDIGYSFHGKCKVQSVNGGRLRGSFEDRKMGYSRRGVEEVLPPLREWPSGSKREFLMGKTAYAGVLGIPIFK